MLLRLGNLSPEQFAERVGSEFTAAELEYLHSVWSRQASLVGADEFHIFEAPSISVLIGSATSRTIEVFKAANARKPFNCAVAFDGDYGWQEGQVAL